LAGVKAAKTKRARLRDLETEKKEMASSEGSELISYQKRRTTANSPGSDCEGGGLLLSPCRKNHKLVTYLTSTEQQMKTKRREEENIDLKDVPLAAWREVVLSSPRGKK